jgi:cytidine deaminase
MTEKNITITYQEGSNWKELPDSHQRLIMAAIEASDLAYAPYSKFHVGAAMITHHGTIITGNNQENAAYPMCNCAEQVCLQKAFSQDPDIKPTLFAIYAKGGKSEMPAAPCGACRQVLCETCDRAETDFPVILVGPNNAYRLFASVKDLLPMNFGGRDLNN